MNSKQTAIAPLGNHYVNIVIGVIGMLLATYGNLLSQVYTQKWFYLIAAILLLTSSLLEQQGFFIALQIIIVSGTAIAFAPISFILKAILPITLSIMAIIYFITQGQLKDRLTTFGCFGIALLAAGYAITNPIVYLLGSVTLMTYSFLSYRRGISIALVWAVLNALFAITAAFAVYRLLI